MGVNQLIKYPTTIDIIPSPNCPYMRKLDPYSHVTSTPYSAGSTKKSPNMAENEIPYNTEAKYAANHFISSTSTKMTTMIVTMSCIVIKTWSFLEGFTLMNAKIKRKTVMKAQNIEL